MQDGKYADQGYLDAWPTLFPNHLRISARSGINLAPWNWSAHSTKVNEGSVRIDGQPLEIFHFARFRPQIGSILFQSGQLEYGIIPWTLRQAIYGPYWDALKQARAEIRTRHPGFDFPKTRLRGWHSFWKTLGPRLLFGSDWLRLGPFFVSGRLSLGRYSGQLLAMLRRRKNHGLPEIATAAPLPEPVPVSPTAET
ncbi:MAG: hypothetical protein QM760_12810 [Nibricoccus sp.]